MFSIGGRLFAGAGLAVLCGLPLWQGTPATEEGPARVEESEDARIDRIIRQLGDDDFEEREKASIELAACDGSALPALHAAMRGDDPEIRWRAEYAVGAIKNRSPEALAFARGVMEAVAVMAEGSVREPSRAEVVALAVKALYPADERLTPRDVADGLSRVHSMEDGELEELLWTAASRWEKRHALKAGADLDQVMARVVKQVDPYASWRNEATIQIECFGNFPGVGLELRLNPVTRKIQVVTPIKAGPAYRAGVRAGDILTRVTRRDDYGRALDKPDVVDVDGMDLEEAEGKLKGTPGVPVEVTVRREGVDHPLTFQVDHAVVEPETVLGVRRTGDDDWDYWFDPEKKVAYIRIARFGENTGPDLARVLETLNGEGMKGLLLDLRCNPGGLLCATIDAANLFTDDGVLVSLWRRDHTAEHVHARPGGRLRNYALVCLVNAETAGGGEVLAACLQDHARARIVGERSGGKTCVPSRRRAGEGRTLRLTTELLLRPNGKKLDRITVPGRPDDEWGVSPDKGLRLDLSDEERDALRADLERRAAIFPHDRPASADGPVFVDRQLERALRALRTEIADP